LGKKGKIGRLKRKPAPRFWPIRRKEFVWVAKPSSGPHALEKCLPLALVLRDILGVAKTRKEAATIVSQGKVYVDGKVRRRDDFPVGLMDVIAMPESHRYYRIMPAHNGLSLMPITKEEAGFKLSRVEDQIVVKNGNMQYNMHDGSNILVRIADPKNPVEAMYETFDTLKLNLPEKQVLERVRTREGSFAVITGGKNMGVEGKIVEIEKAEAKKRRNALVVVEDEKANRYQTILDFVFSVGETRSLASITEASPTV